MDSAIEVASTIAPSDSASQAPKPSASTAPSKSGGPRKGPAKPGVDKNAPPGGVQVPPSGQSKTAKKSQPVSTTIPLTGWGEIDLYPFRRDIEPVFTVDARPFADLVDVAYSNIQSRYSTGGKHIPFALFRYYCFTMWWARVLWLHKSNANTLTTDEKNALNILLAGEEFQLPSYVAQYLANMGNFQQGGEQYYFRMMPHHLSDKEKGVVKKGWFETTDPGNRVTNDTWWLYAQFPVPGVYATYLCNEASVAAPVADDLLTLDDISPAFNKNVSYPTDNIIGWNNNVQLPHHSSWRSTYSLLGWSASTLPADVQTNFNISTSTLKWVSERLSTLKDFKLHSSRQIFLSTQGSTLQTHFLNIEEASTQMHQRPLLADIADNNVNASRYSELALSSRFTMDPKSLAPSFAFGYRLERQMVFLKYDANRNPIYDKMSNFQPWFFTNEKGDAYVAPDATWYTHMNAPFSFGSQPFLNVKRFSTHQLIRSVGLDAALVLSEVR